MAKTKHKKSKPVLFKKKRFASEKEALNGGRNRPVDKKREILQNEKRETGTRHFLQARPADHRAFLPREGSN